MLFDLRLVVAHGLPACGEYLFSVRFLNAAAINRNRLRRSTQLIDFVCCLGKSWEETTLTKHQFRERHTLTIPFRGCVIGNTASYRHSFVPALLQNTLPHITEVAE